MPCTITFSSAPAATHPPARSIYQKRPSVTQTYMIAHQARAKLAKEAQSPDHNLHRLVCHANMLDTLIFDLAHAEEEQEAYLSKLVSGDRAKKPARKSKIAKWAQVVMEKLEEEDEESEEDHELVSSDDDSSDDEYEHWEEDAASSEKSGVNAVVIVSAEGLDSANKLQEEHARLALQRTKSRQPHHIPFLRQNTQTQPATCHDNASHLISDAHIHILN